MLYQILAQSAPPADFGNWFANAAYLSVTAASLIVAWKKLKGTEIAGQPISIRGADRFATKEEHDDLKAEVDRMGEEIHEGFANLDNRRSSSIGNLHEKVEQSIASLRLEMKTDIGGVHDRINDVLGAVRELKGRVEAQRK